MLQFEMEGTSSPISLEFVQEVEKRYGFILPEDYKRFLLKINGGRPKPSMMFTTQNGILTSYLSILFPLISRDAPSLVGNYLFFNKEGKLPRHIVTIGEDPLRNLICISLEKDDCGSIYYWDFMHDDGNEPVNNFLVLISESFSSFIENLRSE
ncbi:SMI1/KNR4 family protein [Paenibacillus oryzisoli]|uniref:SMI1/KNR4 family protein n=1 Tax=Paenibacillus oryzisoli TaxID=1850517 RepID=UPI003D2D4996